jgi:hypothetical protein
VYHTLNPPFACHLHFAGEKNETHQPPSPPPQKKNRIRRSRNPKLKQSYTGATMMNSLIHGGKWTKEEEIYASALIDAFKAGELPRDGIEEGTSPRLDQSVVLAKKNDQRE